MMLWWSREYPVIEASREAEVKEDSLRCVSMAMRVVLYKTPGNVPITLGGPGVIVQIDFATNLK